MQRNMMIRISAYILIFFILVICLQKSVPMLNSQPGKKRLILHWTTAYLDNHITTQKNWFEKNCGLDYCEATMDKTRINDSDAVFFHMFPTDWNPRLPDKAHPEQKFVSYAIEPPTFTWISQIYEGLPDFFDISMTYRKDSNVQVPYITTIKIPPKKVKTVEEVMKRVAAYPKNLTIAWFVSHCSTASKREWYVKELQKYINVDIFGKCGNFQCEKFTRTCGRMLENNYLFYLSFENTICQDYVTEKITSALQYDVIPITMGGADYSKIVPPNSYIDAFDFKSPRHLANYLYELAENKELYLEYFKWKAFYRVIRFDKNLAFCHLCSVINGEYSYKRHENIATWWFNSKTCNNTKNWHLKNL